MRSGILFKEEQDFRGTWYYWLAIVVISPILLFLCYELVGDKVFAQKLKISFAALFCLLLLLLFHFMKMKVEISETGIKYSFFPMVSKRQYSFDELDEFYVREYNSIYEYGGYGVRLGLFGKGWLYNVRGGFGLQLILKSGKKILLGTQKKEELESLIFQLKKNLLKE